MEEDKSNQSKIIELLASQIGVEPEDIENDDFLGEDLHMTPTDMADFAQLLTRAGFITDNLELTELESVGDLIDALSSHEELK